MPGQMIQMHMRHHQGMNLDKLGFKVVPYARLFGADADSVYLQHVAGGAAIIVEEVDTLMTALGQHSVATLANQLEDWTGELHLIGGVFTPRNAQEVLKEL